MQLAPQKYFEFGEFRLEPDEGVLFRGPERIVLPPKIFELLLLFLESGGRVLSRDEIMGRLWPDTAVEAANLKQLVYALRKTLADTSEEEPIIKTIPKRGYRFLLSVRLVHAGQLPADGDVTFTNVLVEEEIVEIDDVGDANSAGRTSPLLLPPKRGVSLRRKFLIGLAAIAALGAGYYFWQRSRPVPLSSENLSLQRLTNTDNLYWAILSPNGQFVAYILLHRDGRQSLHLLELATRSERELIPPDNVAYYGGGFTPDSTQLYFDRWRSTDATGKCDLYQIPLLGDTPRKVLDDVAGPISFAPDGKRFVFTRGDRVHGATKLMIANAADGSDETVIASTPTEYDFIAPNWSPDGKLILFVASEKRDDGTYWYLGEVPVDGGDRRKITEPRKDRMWGALWLGDGNRILINASASDTKLGQLFSVDHATGVMSRLTNDVNYYTGLSASADGKKIVVTQGQRFDDIWVWQVNGQEPAAKITNRSVTIDTLAWMADGHIMYNESENGKHTLWNINPVDRTRARVTADEIQGNSPDVSPDGQNIVFRSNRSGTWQLWMMRSDGTELRKISSDDQVIGRAAFALGGKKLVVERSVDDVERLALMDPDGSSVTDVSPPFVGQWAVAPDGVTIAYRFYDQSVGRTRTAVQSLVDPSKINYIEIIPRDFLVFDPGGDVVLTKRAEPEFDPMSTIWGYPIGGSPPSKFFSNPPDNIYSIRFSKDGKQMAAIAGHTATNLVLFSRSD